MFNTLKKVLEQKPITEQDAGKVQDFILLRWLSGDPRLIALAVELNQHKIETKQLLEAIRDALRGQIKFIKYPSNKSTKDQDLLTPKVARFFNVSVQEAREYLEFLKNYPDEIKYLKEVTKKYL